MIIINIIIYALGVEFLSSRRLLSLTLPFLVRVESTVQCPIFFSTQNMHRCTPYTAAHARGFASAKMSNYDTFGNNAKNHFTRLSFIGRRGSCTVFLCHRYKQHPRPQSVIVHMCVCIMYAHRMIFFVYRETQAKPI